MLKIFLIALICLSQWQVMRYNTSHLFPRPISYVQPWCSYLYKMQVCLIDIFDLYIFVQNTDMFIAAVYLYYTYNYLAFKLSTLWSNCTINYMAIEVNIFVANELQQLQFFDIYFHLYIFKDFVFYIILFDKGRNV